MQPGPADRSYGVQVARLAGLPKKAVTRAAQILKRLETDPSSAETLPLFASAPLTVQEEADAPVSSGVGDRVTALLETVDPDSLTPREALDLVYRLKDEARDTD